VAGIHDVDGRPQRGLIGLIAGQQFQIYSPITSARAVLSFSNWSEVVSAFAADCGRFGSAAIETAVGIGPTSGLPKSQGWLIIRGYYAAFFAAQAILRMLGRSLTQIDVAGANSVEVVANLFGMQGTVSFERGIYLCAADEATRTLTIAKVGEGSHESLWIEFTALVRNLANQILAANPTGRTAQIAAAKLTELQFALTDNNNSPNGKWMSAYRNRVNYSQAHGMWFPYDAHQDYYDGLQKRLDLWKKDVDAITVWPDSSRHAQRFVELAALLVSLCRELSLDMARRCSSGTSFLEYSTIGLLRRLRAM
jgi:hypothetical protein